MANYNNANNWQASQFLTVFIAVLQMHDIKIFDVTKFVDVVMHLKNTPEFEATLNEFSTDFEKCQSQMIEFCGTLKEGKYINGETRYELHFLNRNFDNSMKNLPKGIDINVLNQFFYLMKMIQEKNHQDIILESELLRIVLDRQKGQNLSEEAVEKQRKVIQKYLSILSRFGFLTMSSTYNISIPDNQLEIILKNCQREEYREFMNKLNLFLEYYKDPKKLESIPVNSNQLPKEMSKTPNILNVAKQKEETLLKENGTPTFPTIQDFSNEINWLNHQANGQKTPIVIETQKATRPSISGNTPPDYMKIRSQHLKSNTHFKTIKGVLCSFLSMLQMQGIYYFDRMAFESAMNEMMKDSSFYYKFPLNFIEFAIQYIDAPLEKNNPYSLIDELATTHRIKREKNYSFKLKLSKKFIDLSLNKLTEEDLQKLENLSEQYLMALHKMSR